MLSIGGDRRAGKRRKMTTSTQPLRLHYNPFSSSARRATLVVHHLGLDVELHLVKNLRDPGERGPLTRLNPNVKIPVLEHGDFVLWESNAIMQYLADSTPGQTIYPNEPRARADVHRWLFWAAQHWSPALGTLTWEKWMKPLFGVGDADAHEVARGEREFAQFATVLNDHLAGREWISGPTLTIADFAVATPLMRVKEASIPLQDYPNIAAWFARVEALDAWKKTGQ
jgi:glutathione S-transferase